MPNVFETEGLATSASISKTFLSGSAAILIARLIAENVLPSPGIELVTKIIFARSMPFSCALSAFMSKGRLIERNSSDNLLVP